MAAPNAGLAGLNARIKGREFAVDRVSEPRREVVGLLGGHYGLESIEQIGCRDDPRRGGLDRHHDVKGLGRRRG
jgi:hypothetical protein